MRWAATPLDEHAVGEELHGFVFRDRSIERALLALHVPETCGSRTCGVDVGVVRGPSGQLEIRILVCKPQRQAWAWVHGA